VPEPPGLNKEKKEGRTKARTQQTQEQGREEEEEEEEEGPGQQQEEAWGQNGKVNACAPVSFSRRSRQQRLET
jgi:hypothetical protein